MAEVQDGDNVKIHYTGKFDDGTVFDSSHGREPLEFTVGEHALIPGFEKAVLGMEPGQTKETRIVSEDAYGPHHDNLVIRIGREEFPPDIEPQVGQVLQIRGDGEHPFPVTITHADEQSVTLDANHPLAGRDLNFEIEVISVEKPTTEG